ncbi:hypothetical protein [Kocuria marina]|uniref:hypothetical protein n=1 Tax=Kocuria marina TaxID=223184 RepID=UPI0022E02BEA|nr:hypothetical protein [Kocuria marina]
MSIRTPTPSDREPTVSHAGTTAPQFHVHLSGRGNAGAPRALSRISGAVGEHSGADARTVARAQRSCAVAGATGVSRCAASSPRKA